MLNNNDYNNSTIEGKSCDEFFNSLNKLNLPCAQIIKTKKEDLENAYNNAYYHRKDNLLSYICSIYGSKFRYVKFNKNQKISIAVNVI